MKGQSTRAQEFNRQQEERQSRMPRLYQAIKQHCDLDDESIINAGEHGAAAGWNGFVSYNQTNQFYQENEAMIWAALEDVADDMGMPVLQLIAGFQTAKDVTSEITFKNMLAWYALEAVGQWLGDQKMAKQHVEEDLDLFALFDLEEDGLEVREYPIEWEFNPFVEGPLFRVETEQEHHDFQYHKKALRKAQEMLLGWINEETDPKQKRKWNAMLQELNQHLQEK